MNFHSNEWIMSQVKEHLEESKNFFNDSNIVGIFNQGSGNYGLDYEDSDVDTKLIITPSFREIAMNKQPVSTTHVRADDSHTDWKDIRLYLQTFRKQNLNFVEILFTPYCFINPVYEEEWNRLIKKREEIAHYSPLASIKSMKGIAAEKYFAMEHHYPSRMMWIEKYKYDPKQLHHLLRVEEYIERYIAGEPYVDCLVSKNAEELIAVKKGKYNLEEARKLANDAKNHIDMIATAFIAKHEGEKPLKEIDDLLDDVQYNIMYKAIKNEIGTR